MLAIVVDLRAGTEKIGSGRSHIRPRSATSAPQSGRRSHALAFPGEFGSLAAGRARARAPHGGRQGAAGARLPGARVQELQDLRLELRNRLRAEPLGSPLRHVGPWVWTPKSLGQALSTTGLEQGAELRVSFYKRPIT